MNLYHYAATVLHVVDGDTVDLLVSLGFDTTFTGRFRLIGINTPESYGPDACDAGRAAKAWLTDLLKVDTRVIVKTHKDKKEKYGRYLAEVYLADDATKTVNQMLIEAGHAVAYDGGKR